MFDQIDKVLSKSSLLHQFKLIFAVGTLLAVLLAGKTSAAVPGEPYNWLPRSHHQVCSSPAQVAAKCEALLLTNANTGNPLASVSYVSGYTPTDLNSAYKLLALPPVGSNFSWNGKTVAIVDAYDNPNAASDLLKYRKQFNLPLCSTSSTSPSTSDLVGCLFTKANQNGAASPLPGGNTGWGQEIDLDIEMASASCPNCKILLVEASSNSFTNLAAAVDRAATMGASAISNSYGGGEFFSETSSTYNSHFNHSGIAITAAAGDSGYGVEFPAASQYVTAVGGTTLTKNTSARGWGETVWSGTGSGCSSYVPSLSYQPKIGNCTHRIVADVSADANPNTGVAVYDSYGSSGNANWYVFGGTSVATPLIAGIYVSAGNTIKYNEYPYAHTANLNDVVSGSNGSCTSRSFFGGNNTANAALCQAFTGFDGPSGLGTPNGILAF